MTLSRRDLVGASGLALLGASAISGRVQAQSIPEAPTTTANTMQPPLYPTSGPDYQPVVTLNGWTLKGTAVPTPEGGGTGGRLPLATEVTTFAMPRT